MFCAAVPPLEVNGGDDIAIGCGVDDGKRVLRALGRVLRTVLLEFEDAKRSEGLGGTYEGVAVVSSFLGHITQLIKTFCYKTLTHRLLYTILLLLAIQATLMTSKTLWTPTV